MASVKDAIETMARNIEEKTGKSVGAWTALARRSGFEKHGQIVRWLKSQHKVGHGYANYIALQAIKSVGGGTAEDEIATLFAGSKSELKPIYDKLIATVTKFGPEVEIALKKAYVSLRRNKQFALLQPSTPTRLDIGLILKGVKPTERLEVSGSFNAMFTHRVRITGETDIDSEVKRWLKQAYDEA
jgi:hypothetical protein